MNSPYVMINGSKTVCVHKGLDGCGKLVYSEVFVMVVMSMHYGCVFVCVSDMLVCILYGHGLCMVCQCGHNAPLVCYRMELWSLFCQHTCLTIGPEQARGQ